MQRFKKPKKTKETTPEVSTHFIMKVIMPCVMLGCKDEFNLKEKEKDIERLHRLSVRIQRYINLIADGQVTEKQLNEFMRIEEATDAAIYLKEVSGGITNEKQN